MYTVLLVIHVIITIALIGIVLVQRSDADGLSGLGGGGGSMSGFMTGRSKANFMTRATAVLAASFILTSLVLGILISHGKTDGTIAEKLAKEQAAPVPATDTALPGVGLKKQQPAPTAATPDVGKEKAADKLTVPSAEKDAAQKKAPASPAVPKPE